MFGYCRSARRKTKITVTVTPTTTTTTTTEPSEGEEEPAPAPAPAPTTVTVTVDNDGNVENTTTTTATNGDQTHIQDDDGELIPIRIGRLPVYNGYHYWNGCYGRVHPGYPCAPSGPCGPCAPAPCWPTVDTGNIRHYATPSSIVRVRYPNGYATEEYC